ncbi:MAG: substrate-binding domain-containing protein [Demequinaceae bacterium]|nr:substrate-binding domain-containing protein [Demequinaceae bacterium]
MSIKTHLARAATVAAAGAGLFGLTACSTAINGETMNTAATTGPSAAALVRVGFVAVGADDAWRAANEADIQNSFTADAGFDLEYAPSTNGDQKSQIDAFNTFVDEGVDAILLSATESKGWTDSLQRAKDAEIPVILIDRGVEPDVKSLYVTRVTPGDADTAKSVADWAITAFPEGARYFVLEGPSDDPKVGLRVQGWDGVMGAHPEFVKVGAQGANWSTDEAKSATATMLAANNNDVALIFAHSDEMGLGAAQAVEEAGLVPGTNVKIVTIGGSKDALQALLGGRLSLVVEYNPLVGKTAVDVVRTALADGTADSVVVVPSATFASITQEQIDARLY